MYKIEYITHKTGVKTEVLSHMCAVLKAKLVKKGEENLVSFSYK